MKGLMACWNVVVQILDRSGILVQQILRSYCILTAALASGRFFFVQTLTFSAELSTVLAFALVAAIVLTWLLKVDVLGASASPPPLLDLKLAGYTKTLLSLRLAWPKIAFRQSIMLQ